MNVFNQLKIWLKILTFHAAQLFLVVLQYMAEIKNQVFETPIIDKHLP